LYSTIPLGSVADGSWTKLSGLAASQGLSDGVDYQARHCNGEIRRQRPISLILDVCEKVQNFALRGCSKQWNTSYDVLLQLFSLPTLQERRLYLDLPTIL